MPRRRFWVWLVVWGLVGCRPGVESASEPVVLATFTVIADMAQQVAGDRVRVESLVKPGVEIHSYEPTPREIARIRQARLVLENGLGLEQWTARFYQQLQEVPRVTVSAGITPVMIAPGQPDPHAWMSPRLALIYVDNIRQALSRIDPDHAHFYTQNAQRYQQQIRAFDQKFQQFWQSIPAHRRYLVTCEGAFGYMARDYGFQPLYLWPMNAEQEGTPQQIRRVIDQVRARQIPVVFCESTVNPQAQQQVARETGARFGGILYVDSLTVATGPAPTYVRLLEHNLNTLRRGFSMLVSLEKIP
ncbi:MAG: metal ABC transporter substrate-binding protein [Gloeomargarita sp. SKYBB_i_bin120]|nr:metal ABC transporter substrate-binding protein [Gloeomargarita sp. SKYB120]MDW8177594.1 metal ABC transporter substrate-binding protein [Gloeomargarita sp. SKYBB_i_bin120]